MRRDVPVPGGRADIRRLTIAHCLPDQHWIEALRAEPKDAAHIQQKYIAAGLKARGHSVFWVAPDGTEQLRVSDASGTRFAPRSWSAGTWFSIASKLAWKSQRALNIPYLNYFSNLRRYDAYMPILRSCDLVFERNALYNSGAAMACERLGLPFFVFFDADQIAELDFMGAPLSGLLRWRAASILRYNLNVARKVICVSKSAKRHLIEKWNVPHDKAVVLPNAVDVTRFRPEPEAAAWARADLKVTAQPLVVFVGNFYPWHDVRTLLKAFALLLGTHQEARLVLVGEGREREAMKALAVELGIEDAVRFTGFVSHDEVKRYLSAADIAVAPIPPMHGEMWLSPMKLFEYMASGKAVVASRMGQVADVIVDGQNGLLVEPGDELKLRDALARLIDDTNFRDRLGQQAREDAVAYYSWDSYLSKLEDVLLRGVE